ncbi:hypothetical protein Sste5346_005749 [Sporothrix stenoceras]|uniref:Major facilitator superfamily (MFS) profile domain-containing protein n=1 Tax=Sporothrix stenoceras TaxID=5173 RepID=A0ABR3Z4U6_9PEZI
MMIGSTLCTATPTSTFAVLLLGRAIQGLGCAGLNVVVRVILLDRVSLRENAKNWSIFSFTAGMSYGVGPVIGALTWAGATYGWATAAVLVPLCVGLLLVAAFIGYEHLMAPGRLFSRMWPRQKSMLPWTLLGSKDIGLLVYINFATGAAMYSLYGPTYAGTQLLYYTPGLGVGVYLSMYFLNGWPRNTFVPLMLGSIVEAVGVGVLAWALYSGHLPAIFGMMALTGAGTGLRLMPASLHAVGFFPQHVATVVSLMAVALPLGGTLALTVMAAVFNNTSGIASSSPLRSVDTLDQLPPEALADVVHRAKMGIVWAYVDCQRRDEGQEGDKGEIGGIQSKS